MKRFLGCGAVMLFLFVSLSGALQAADTGKEAEFPLGDRAAGREVFLKYQCFACHQVQHDASMKSPFSAAETRGPDLAPNAQRPLSLAEEQMKALRLEAGIPQPDYTPEFYAAAVMAPSHSIAPGFGKGSAEDLALSPMKDFSSVMTVQELKDVVAYLTQAPS
ncbi:MAG: cytochrome c [Candidatus Omnitrophica bacterium]|nr:cytochrome c [Candidatus Omnitrophota bacterium]